MEELNEKIKKYLKINFDADNGSIIGEKDTDDEYIAIYDIHKNIILKIELNNYGNLTIRTLTYVPISFLKDIINICDEVF